MSSSQGGFLSDRLLRPLPLTVLLDASVRARHSPPGSAPGSRGHTARVPVLCPLPRGQCSLCVRLVTRSPSLPTCPPRAPSSPAQQSLCPALGPQRPAGTCSRP